MEGSCRNNGTGNAHTIFDAKAQERQHLGKPRLRSIQPLLTTIKYSILFPALTS
jgi:hypothetical protein